VNMFVLGSLMGDLGPSATEAGEPRQYEDISREQAEATEPEMAAETNPPAPAVAPSPASQVSAKPAPAGAGHFAIKGVTRNGAKSVVIVDTGVKAYTLFLGDSLNMQTADGTNRVQFENLDAAWVTLNIDGKPVKLPAR
jgi:hypothetical protein